MGRGRLEVLVDNAWRTHVGRRGGEECYDTHRSVLYRDPRASPWPLRVTGVSYARARQRPGGLTVSPHARFGTASGGGRKCGEKGRGVGRRVAPRTAGHPSRGRDTCGSEGQFPPRRAMLLALCTLKEQHCSRNAPPQVPLTAYKPACASSLKADPDAAERPLTPHSALCRFCLDWCGAPAFPPRRRLRCFPCFAVAALAPAPSAPPSSAIEASAAVP